jgi:uncharacterized protein (DUF1697 family)
MAKLAILLRGINVGGNARLAMPDVRRVLESLGYTEVQTYLQSGNAVVEAGRKSPSTVEREVYAALNAEFGLPNAVMVRTHRQLEAVVKGNPFPEAATEAPKFLHVAFLADKPDPAVVATLDPEMYAPERFAFGDDRELYLYFANGSGRSKMATGSPMKLGMTTSRNWNTVLKLAELTA